MTSAPHQLELDAAGRSADDEADQLAPLIDGTERQVATLLETLRELRRRQRDYRRGADGERLTAGRVHQVLVDLGSADWHLLADRRWPGSKGAQIDIILVGPPGVLLIDAKAWRDVRIDGDGLWCGQARADDEIESARRAADAVADVLALTGTAPPVVRPVLLFVGHHLPAKPLDGVLLVGELDLQRELVRMGVVLDSAQVAAAVAALDAGCPPAGRQAEPARRTVHAPKGTTQAPELFDVDGIVEAAMDAASREPIESWMTWLHPSQAQQVTRDYSGPARLRGAAGTGKTVVALHRARHLARLPGARVLVTSYVRTLPDVQRSLFARLAPDLVGRVQFCGVHSLSARLLRDRNVDVTVAARGGDCHFSDAWSATSATGPLGVSGLPRSYWQDEVQQVIKGRGLTSLDDYLALVRVGRGTPLRVEQRRAVWQLYQAYESLLAADGVCDYADLLAYALASVRSQPLARPYTAVIVDELQDLTCVGLRLLHALVGDAPNGLFLVGDGQQSVYPGGFTLAEAGLSVTGRATVLHRNYRNRAEILQTALALVKDDVFDDLEPESLPGARDVESARPGGQVKRVVARDSPSQAAALLTALHFAVDDGTRLGDIAVLVPDNRAAGRWARELSQAGVEVTMLRAYDGRTTDAVKVGTYQRSKGLEFACVFLPDHDLAVPAQRPDEDEAAYRERAQLQRRCLFVAMTRARDRLWLGRVAPLREPPT